MQLTLSMDAEHECKLHVEPFLSRKESVNSTSMDELLSKASETFEMSQTTCTYSTSPDNWTLLPTAPSSVDLLTLTCMSIETSFTQLKSESVVVSWIC